MLEQISVCKFGNTRTKDEVAQTVLAELLDKSLSITDIYYIMRQTYEDARLIAEWLIKNELAVYVEKQYTITAKGINYIKALQRADRILKGAAA